MLAPEKRQHLHNEAVHELESAVAPASRHFWEVTVSEDLEVRWASKLHHAFVIRVTGGYKVHKLSGSLSAQQHQMWSSIPTLEYALGLGEFA